MRLPVTYLLFLLLMSSSCRDYDQSPQEQDLSEVITDLNGIELLPLVESESTVQRKKDELTEAKKNFDEDSTSLENIIWYGRRVAYLYEYLQAIEIYTKGLQHHPQAAELYRHRGHRYISIRKFDHAIADFQRAAELVRGREIEIEPDGIPNKLNIPLSTLQFNIWYHWALAYYLKGDFEKAEQLFTECMAFSTNSDLQVATTDWLYMTLRRQDKVDEATALLERVDEDMVIIENDSYFKRLLMYKGLFKPTDLLDLENEEEEAQLNIVTQGYGVANWYYYHGDISRAESIYTKILEADYWPAFGYIAAEADVYRGL